MLCNLSVLKVAQKGRRRKEKRKKSKHGGTKRTEEYGEKFFNTKAQRDEVIRKGKGIQNLNAFLKTRRVRALTLVFLWAFPSTLALTSESPLAFRWVSLSV
jgi:hypothetical protein